MTDDIQAIRERDEDMLRMSRTILREIQLAPTWMDTVIACECLETVRKRWVGQRTIESAMSASKQQGKQA